MQIKGLLSSYATKKYYNSENNYVIAFNINVYLNSYGFIKLEH